ncbi:PREDICTED: protein MCM10 homolog isoform X2 [Tarenaya hassleriana]|uniref:protein MCM10 homolog isoform X2 n=1 Tax=Tarenaya hassleriana TaxID=28532 RepID=UPI00053C4105|nr:PREDICTED: protein MCM10 homolog isoform X2 [Tarenaya hassleriana]
MDINRDELDLLLSLEDRVLETPPDSPSAALGGYLTDDESPKRRAPVDLSDFKSVVQDCLSLETKPANKTGKPKGLKNCNLNDVEKFSGLRIRNQLLSPAEISDRFSEIRFVRLPTIKNLLVGDRLSGCWATIGVLTEKGLPKTSSIGQPYCVWKLSCLNVEPVSLFLFGDAYLKNCKEKAGTVLGLFNCSVRKDNMGHGFSLSVSSAGQIVKIGASADYGVCNGKKKDGIHCTSVINKRQGAFCKFHKLNASDTFATKRTELKGGNLRTAFRGIRAEGVYTVDPVADKKGNQPARVLTVEALKKALRAEKVTTVGHSQGIRFLNEMARISGSNQRTGKKRKSSPELKRKRAEDGSDSPPEKRSGKMIALDICSSDEEEG